MMWRRRTGGPVEAEEDTEEMGEIDRKLPWHVNATCVGDRVNGILGEGSRRFDAHLTSLLKKMAFNYGRIHEQNEMLNLEHLSATLRDA